ncbi:RNA 2'-phosphotransferase [Pseudomonas sp. CR3202]|uniref:RNA 2'-phosphotransferase n=1 Tax=Pseudomonas sp. CR3202 TaxID=3351532 RepID=UPI003BF37B8A
MNKLNINYVSLSRIASHALRHEPWLYELELDDEGWVPVEELLSALRAEKPEWSSLSEADLNEMIAASDKKRHELRDGKIRALYGHSVPDKLLKQPAEPPAVLYHGTSPEMAVLIKASGLQPMSRQYVHLSVDTATAEQVGRRKARAPVLLEVRAKLAAESGVPFYRGNDLVWLADQVPAQFIMFPD